mgnify:CR=1 FL=1
MSLKQFFRKEIFVNLQNGVGFLKIQIFSTIIALVLYGLGCYIIDIKENGYNVIVCLSTSTKKPFM